MEGENELALLEKIRKFNHSVYHDNDKKMLHDGELFVRNFIRQTVEKGAAAFSVNSKINIVRAEILHLAVNYLVISIYLNHNVNRLDDNFLHNAQAFTREVLKQNNVRDNIALRSIFVYINQLLTGILPNQRTNTLEKIANWLDKMSIVSYVEEEKNIHHHLALLRNNKSKDFADKISESINEFQVPEYVACFLLKNFVLSNIDLNNGMLPALATNAYSKLLNAFLMQGENKNDIDRTFCQDNMYSLNNLSHSQMLIYHLAITDSEMISQADTKLSEKHFSALSEAAKWLVFKPHCTKLSSRHSEDIHYPNTWEKELVNMPCIMHVECTNNRQGERLDVQAIDSLAREGKSFVVVAPSKSGKSRFLRAIQKFNIEADASQVKPRYYVFCKLDKRGFKDMLDYIIHDRFGYLSFNEQEDEKILREYLLKQNITLLIDDIDKLSFLSHQNMSHFFCDIPLIATAKSPEKVKLVMPCYSTLLSQVKISPLNVNDLSRFLRQNTAVQQDFFKEITNHPILRSLAKDPFMLQWMMFYFKTRSWPIEAQHHAADIAVMLSNYMLQYHLVMACNNNNVANMYASLSHDELNSVFEPFITVLSEFAYHQLFNVDHEVNLNALFNDKQKAIWLGAFVLSGVIYNKDDQTCFEYPFMQHVYAAKYVTQKLMHNERDIEDFIRQHPFSPSMLNFWYFVGLMLPNELSKQFISCFCKTNSMSIPEDLAKSFAIRNFSDAHCYTPDNQVFHQTIIYLSAWYRLKEAIPTNFIPEYESIDCLANRQNKLNESALPLYHHKRTKSLDDAVDTSNTAKANLRQSFCNRLCQ